MINKEKAHKILDVCLQNENETSIVFDMIQIVRNIDCSKCPILSDCKRHYARCDEFIKKYLTEEDKNANAQIS